MKNKTPGRRQIYCCACVRHVKARLTTGAEIYPNRRDLATIPMWKCDACKGYVGCHPDSRRPNRNMPLGFISTAPIRQVRKQVHALLDPIWKNRLMTRSKIYHLISQELGYPFHAAELKSVDQAGRVIAIIRRIKAGLIKPKPESEPS